MYLKTVFETNCVWEHFLFFHPFSISATWGGWLLAWISSDWFHPHSPHFEAQKISAGATKIQTYLKMVWPMPFFLNWHCQSFKKSIWWEFSYSLLTGWFSRTASRFSRHGENRVYKGSSSLQLIGGGTPVGGERAPAVLTGCPLFREASEKEKRCTSTQGAVPTGKTCNPSHMCVFR